MITILIVYFDYPAEEEEIDGGVRSSLVLTHPHLPSPSPISRISSHIEHAVFITPPCSLISLLSRHLAVTVLLSSDPLIHLTLI